MERASKHIFAALALILAGSFSITTLAFDWSSVGPNANEESQEEDTPPPPQTEDMIHARGLEQLPNDHWQENNPYRGNAKAVAEGARLFSRVGCKDCHGIKAVSGGTTPDLRKLGPDKDALYLERMRNGSSKGMPSFENRVTQEAMWAIRSYIDVRWAQYNDSDVEWAKNEEFEQYRP